MSRFLLAVGLMLALLDDLWLPPLGHYLIVADVLRRADAIVPLGGDRLRPLYSATLYQMGYASWLVSTAPGAAETPLYPWNDMVTVAVEQGLDPDRVITVAGRSANTYQEAVNVRQLAEREGWRSLIVVTSSYHTRRARIIFDDVFSETRIQVIVRPVEADPYNPDAWWKSRSGRVNTLLEYGKVVRYHLGFR